MSAMIAQMSNAGRIFNALNPPQCRLPAPAQAPGHLEPSKHRDGSQSIRLYAPAQI
jgi:hypothetical protein